MVSNNRRALVIFSKSPELVRRNPDEPYAGLPWTDLDSLFFAMFDDVIETANSLSSVDIYILKSDPDISNEFLTRHGLDSRILELHGESTGEEIHYAFETLFSKKYEQIILMLEPNPLLTKNDIKTAFDLLQYDDDCVVVGQYPEGKYFLIGLKSNHSDLFESDNAEIQSDYLQRLCETDIMVFPMPPKYSLDSGTNLLRLKYDLEELSGGNGFSHRTRTMFKMIDKKYKIRRPH